MFARFLDTKRLLFVGQGSSRSATASSENTESAEDFSPSFLEGVHLSFLERRKWNDCAFDKNKICGVFQKAGG